MLKSVLICAAFSFVFVSSAAMAQSGRGACVADIKKACGTIKPGGGRIATCLKERVADVSDVCKARLAEAAAALKTCRADIEKQQCSSTVRIQRVTCVRAALTNLGDDCKAAIAAIVTGKK